MEMHGQRLGELERQAASMWAGVSFFLASWETRGEQGGAGQAYLASQMPGEGLQSAGRWNRCLFPKSGSLCSTVLVVGGGREGGSLLPREL